MATDPPTRRLRSAVTVALAGLVLSACSEAAPPAQRGTGAPPATAVGSAPATTLGSAPASGPVSPPAPAEPGATTTSPARRIPPASGPRNELDVMFATDMIPHHRQAVEMATDAATRARDPRVKKLAARIRAAQDAEVDLMAAWLKQWGQPVPAPDKAHTAHGPGMMNHAEMEDLKDATGPAFDRMFCDMMIRHHEGALQMAGATKERGRNQAVRALAAEVARTQAAEVTELRGILRSL